MILVITGTHPQQFDRALKEVDNLIAMHVINEPVMMQTGYSNYLPKNAKWFKFTNYENMLKLMKKASYVITHGGIGSVLLSLRMNKKTIVVPRLKKFGEHTNDHQLEIVKELDKQNKIIPVYDITQLSNVIENVGSFKSAGLPKSNKTLQLIGKFLKQLE